MDQKFFTELISLIPVPEDAVGEEACPHMVSQYLSLMGVVLWLVWLRRCWSIGVRGALGCFSGRLGVVALLLFPAFAAPLLMCVVWQRPWGLKLKF